MEKKNVFVVGGSSGIGLEIVKRLSANAHEVYVGSRNDRALVGIANVHHLSLDVTAESMNLENLPETLQGLVYCPGSITLKPFQRLTIDDFLEDFWEYRFWIGLKSGLVLVIILVLVLLLKIFNGQALISIQ